MRLKEREGYITTFASCSFVKASSFGGAVCVGADWVLDRPIVVAGLGCEWACCRIYMVVMSGLCRVNGC